jgi:hypothetical protein
MMNIRGFAVAAVFLVGCAVGGVSSQLVVPRASAQQGATMTRWEYLCPRSIDHDVWPTEVNRAGAQGWELTTSQLSQGTIYACFKRPKM